MSLSGSTSRHCYALQCANGDYRLHRWRQSECPMHHVTQDSCACPEPFVLFTFPTKKKNPEARQRWLSALSRADPKQSDQLLEPKTGHRVCSDHFIDGRPTLENPDPLLKLGQSRKRCMKNRGTKQQYQNDSYESDEETISAGSVTDSAEALILLSTSSNYSSSSCFKIACKFIVFILICLVRRYKRQIQLLQKENESLKAQIQRLRKKKT